MQDGCTALDSALEQEYPEVAEVLRAAKAAKDALKIVSFNAMHFGDMQMSKRHSQKKPLHCEHWPGRRMYRSNETY